MASDGLSPAGVTAPAAGKGAGGEILQLLRRYDQCCALPAASFSCRCRWRVTWALQSVAVGRAPARRRRARRGAACAPGELTPTGQRPGQRGGRRELWLRFVERPLGRSEYRAWRRDRRRARPAAGAAGSPRSACSPGSSMRRCGCRCCCVDVCLAGRRPRRSRNTGPGPARTCPYYGRVTRDRGFIALQYWFFYAMNDWRSTFAGVNDHEADWEQVTVFLPDPPDLPAARSGWPFPRSTRSATICAADPTIPTWSGGTPTRSSSPALGRIGGLPAGRLPGHRRAARAWTAARRHCATWPGCFCRGHARTPAPPLGIPFIDYRRGDGPGVGPGEAKKWRPVPRRRPDALAAGLPGLVGTGHPRPVRRRARLAGPRYERDGSVRLCWSRPGGMGRPG